MCVIPSRHLMDTGAPEACITPRLISLSLPGSVMDGQEEGREDAISECSVTDIEADESSIMDKSPKYADANATKKAISCQGHPLEAAQSIYDDQEKDDFRESSEISELDMERNCETLLGSKAKLRGRSSTLVAVESDFTKDGQGEIEASSGLDSEEGESKNEFSQPLSIAKQGLKPPSTRKVKSTLTLKLFYIYIHFHKELVLV